MPLSSPRPAGPSRTLRMAAAVAAAFAALSFSAAPAPADPPPWAPAHGYRAKKGRHMEQESRSAPQLPPGLQKGHCRHRMFDESAVGTLIGAAVGGHVGAHLGKGDRRLAATALGVVLGAVIGQQVSGSIARSDEICFTQTFEHAPDRETITWNNSRQGAEYQVTPTRTVRTRSGEYCREYQAKASVGGRITDTYGTACRQPDGSWKLVN